MTSLIVSTIMVSIACAVLYRLGGLGNDFADKHKYPRWMFNTKVRDLGVPISCLAWNLMHFDAVWYIHALCAFLTLAALTTYWDEVFKEDNFYAHGLMIGLAYVPYLDSLGFVGFIFIIVRAVVMMGFMGYWCKWFSNDYVEECGRGFIIGATLPLLII